MPMVIHKRAIEKISASKIRKQREGLRDFVFVIFTQAAFYMYFGFYR